MRLAEILDPYAVVGVAGVPVACCRRAVATVGNNAGAVGDEADLVEDDDATVAVAVVVVVAVVAWDDAAYNCRNFDHTENPGSWDESQDVAYLMKIASCSA